MNDRSLTSSSRRRLLATSVALPAVSLGASAALASNAGGQIHAGYGGHQHSPYRDQDRYDENMPLDRNPRVPADLPSSEEEQQQLEALYQTAMANGERLRIYAGGDTPTQQDLARTRFRNRFPGLDMDIIVDYSKIHDVRVDNQLATDSVVPDVVQLQTIQDFERWKREGHLLPWKPAGFEAIHPFLRDPDGAWLSVMVLAFSYQFNRQEGGPATPEALANPVWRGKIASAYPQDDDAVLFLFKLYASRYGWEWVRRLSQQDIRFARGSNTPREAVNRGERQVGVGSSGSLTDTSSLSRWVTPTGHPFMSWGQRAAILRSTRNPNAAKLYLSWMVSQEMQQQSFNGWSVRVDVQPPGDLPPIWTLEDAHLADFPAFMRDRARVERWRQTFVMYFGDVQGEPSPGVLGLHPGA